MQHLSSVHSAGSLREVERRMDGQVCAAAVGFGEAAETHNGDVRQRLQYIIFFPGCVSRHLAEALQRDMDPNGDNCNAALVQLDRSRTCFHSINNSRGCFKATSNMRWNDCRNE